MKPVSTPLGMRGEPLILLVVLLAGWSILRISFWDPAPGRQMAGTPALPAGLVASAPTRPAQAFQPQRQGGEEGYPARAPIARPHLFERPLNWQAPPLPSDLPMGPVIGMSMGEALPVPGVVGHTMLLAAGLSQMEIPHALLAHYRAAATRPAPLFVPSVPDAVAQPALSGRTERSDIRRWSADAWMLWRRGEGSPLGAGRPGYGRSQAGAVIHYELAPRSGHRPQAHLRASSALEGGRERMAAAGLSARLLPSVPLRVAGELRAADNGEGVDFRPSVYAVTELPRAEMAGGLGGEAYVQGGYVGGASPTPFVDAQARLDRRVARVGDFELRAGAGAWGGAQEDVARLDIGPSASLTFGVGEARGRLAADYRIRVAGAAEPASGPALTLSAGF